MAQPLAAGRKHLAGGYAGDGVFMGGFVIISVRCKKEGGTWPAALRAVSVL